ncbi:hypothetical protein NDI52_22215 [Leptolyngbya sp. PL-A3]|nr:MULTISPECIES: hypothetical protein [unclassified Leptolyngbya]
MDHINADIAGGYESGVIAAPALFINGIRYVDRWNVGQLIVAITATANQGS